MASMVNSRTGRTLAEVACSFAPMTLERAPGARNLARMWPVGTARRPTDLDVFDAQDRLGCVCFGPVRGRGTRPPLWESRVYRKREKTERSIHNPRFALAGRWQETHCAAQQLSACPGG